MIIKYYFSYSQAHAILDHFQSWPQLTVSYCNLELPDIDVSHRGEPKSACDHPANTPWPVSMGFADDHRHWDMAGTYNTYMYPHMYRGTPLPKLPSSL